MRLGDVSRDFRDRLNHLIEIGTYDQQPEFKEAARVHLAAWDVWVHEAVKLEWYWKSIFRFFIFLPWYWAQSQRERKAYRFLQWTQDRLNSMVGKGEPEEYDVEADQSLTAQERELISQFIQSPQMEAAIANRRAK